MSGRTFPKKNSGKMNRDRIYGRGGRDEEGHNGYYNGNQENWLEGQIRGGERREEKSGWNRGGAGRDSEDRPSTHRQRDPRYGDYSRRSHRNDWNGGDRDHEDRRREDRDRGYGRNGGNVSRYDRDMNGVRGNRRIQYENRSSVKKEEPSAHDYPQPTPQHHSREQHESPRLPPRTRRGNTPPPIPVELAQRSSSRVSPPRTEEPDLSLSRKTIITEARSYSDEDDDYLTEKTKRKPGDAIAKIREKLLRKKKEASTPPGSPPPFVKDDE